MIYVDANVVSEVARPSGSRTVKTWYADRRAELRVSAIVVAEVVSGAQLIGNPALRQAYLAVYEALMDDLPAPDIVDGSIARRAADLRGSSRRAGVQLALADALIAATALRHRAPLATRNTKDFKATGLALIDPWEDA